MLATLEQAKAMLGISPAVIESDAEILGFIQKVQHIFSRVCDRDFDAEEGATELVMPGSLVWTPCKCPLVEITKVEAVNSQDFTVEDITADCKYFIKDKGLSADIRFPYREGIGYYMVTHNGGYLSPGADPGTNGFTNVPGDLNRVTLDQVRFYYSTRKRQNMESAGGTVPALRAMDLIEVDESATGTAWLKYRESEFVEGVPQVLFAYRRVIL